MANIPAAPGERVVDDAPSDAPSNAPSDALCDARIDTPYFHRNIDAIRKVVAERLGSDKKLLLEIGSGSGQHACALANALSQLTILPSDPNAENRASIAAWRAHEGLANLLPPIDVDVSNPTWPEGLTQPHTTTHDVDITAGFKSVDAILCCNVIHIAPWNVATGLFAGAGQLLSADGVLMLYGPYKQSGKHNSEGNADFDLSLKARDPSWGIRDIDDVDQLAAANGLQRRAFEPMPANNFMPIYGRS